MTEVTLAAIPERQERNRSRGRRGQVLRRLRANRLAMIGAVIVGSLIAMAIAAPFISPENPTDMPLEEQYRPPSWDHPFGTDDFGRDILSRIMHGARISLRVGIIAVGIALIAGSTMGLLAGYCGGWIDLVSGWVVDVMLAFPGLLLALGVIAVLGSSLTNVMIAVGVGAMPAYARLMRGQVIALRRTEYVEAALAIGAGGGRIVVRHILPNAVSPLIVLASLGIADSILAAASLSFIGLGAKPPSPEWGAMLSAGRSYLRDEWWIATFPGIAIAITVLGFNLLGDGLRDAFDPHAMSRTAS